MLLSFDLGGMSRICPNTTKRETISSPARMYGSELYLKLKRMELSAWLYRGLTPA